MTTYLLSSVLLLVGVSQTAAFDGARAGDIGDASRMWGIGHRQTPRRESQQGSSGKLLLPLPVPLGAAAARPVRDPLWSLRGGGAEASSSTTDPALLVSPSRAPPRKQTLVLFDVDGTLTPPRQKVRAEVLAMLHDLRQHVAIGVVGGSDMPKVQEQLGEEGAAVMDFLFAENGLVAYQQREGGKGREELGHVSLAKALGEEKLQRLVNWCLGYLSRVSLPLKRGTFIEYRSGMINVSPIGRNCSPEERNAFEKFDNDHGVRAKMVAALLHALPDLNLECSIGGQISLDVMPRGWDKTFALHYLPPDLYTAVHFFGDKTEPGGNDHGIFEHPRTLSHAVSSPDDTVRICRELFIPK